MQTRRHHGLDQIPRPHRLRRLRIFVATMVAASAAVVVTQFAPQPVAAEETTDLSAGEGHTCAVVNAGVQCWGENDAGQLGNGTYDRSTTPVVVEGLSTVVAVSAGKRHTCAIKADGTLWCWGAGNFGALGLGIYTGAQTTPQHVTALSDVAHVSAGYTQTCATLDDGSLWCTGAITGDGTGNGSPAFVAVSGISNAKMSAAGEFSSCAVLDDDTAKCWGSNSFGKLGIGVLGGTYDAPQVVTGLSGVDTIHTKGSTTCALHLDDTVSCWGAGFYGQMGDGTLNGQISPQQVPGLTGVDMIDLASSGVCTMKIDTTVWCWGANAYYMAQQAASVSELTVPTQLSVPFTPARIAAGQLHYCAIQASGTDVACWGSNRTGQIGAAVTDTINVPTLAASVTGDSVGAGISKVCAVQSGGEVDCWGAGPVTASGTAFPPIPPTEVVGVTTAEAVELGGSTGALPRDACARNTDGTLTCWPPDGEDSGISLGATDHGMGSAFGCAVLTDTTVECWGRNNLGQLGNNSTTDSTTPVAVDSLTTAVKVDAGFAHACAVLADETAVCWGHNNGGKLGDGTETQSLVPVAVDSLTDVADITAGDQHTCAVKTDGTVWCWGSSYPGPTLGDGLNTSSSVPVQVTGITDAIAVEAGVSVTCALHDDGVVAGTGSVSCWGVNSSGELGNGTMLNASTPVAATGVTSADQLSLTYSTPCVHNTDDTIMCWGQNTHGQTGTPSYSSTPIVSSMVAVPLCNGMAVTVDIGAGDLPTEASDVILGTSGVDTIDALGGDDVVCGRGSGDTIMGGDGLDTIFGDGGADDLDGGQGNDTIFGGAAGDDIYGAGGGDKLYGEGGPDLVRGGNGDDLIEGGPGNDELRGQNGTDRIWANTATDASTTFTDVMYGGGLFDTIYGDAGPDTIYGGHFADSLFGRNGDDDLFGGPGEDDMNGGAHTIGDDCDGGTLNSNGGDEAQDCETVINVP